jgi:U3 small nucleolar RNA-associated protein 13
MSDFSCLRTLSGHTSSVLRVHWVSAGTQLLSSGSDGLVKLWSAKASDCVTTLDGHEDKVWALDVAHAADGSEGLEVWSGSADSVLVRWRDSSKEEQEEASAKRELELQHEQELAIAVHAREYDSALRLALRLRHPRSLRTVLEKLLPTDDGEDQLKALVATMDQEDLAHCLRCARDWNTTATHSLVAQRLMYAVLRSTPLSKLNATPQLKELLEALIPYTERHFERLDRLQQSSQFLSYTLSAMKVLEAPKGGIGDDAADEGGGAGAVDEDDEGAAGGGDDAAGGDSRGAKEAEKPPAAPRTRSKRAR